MLTIWNKYKNAFSPQVSPLCPVIELEIFPMNLQNLERKTGYLIKVLGRKCEEQSTNKRYNRKGESILVQLNAVRAVDKRLAEEEW